MHKLKFVFIIGMIFFINFFEDNFQQFNFVLLYWKGNGLIEAQKRKINQQVNTQGIFANEFFSEDDIITFPVQFNIPANGLVGRIKKECMIQSMLFGKLPGLGGALTLRAK